VALLQVLPGEESPEVVPLWRWNGKYSSSRDAMPAGSDGWQGEGEGVVPLAQAGVCILALFCTQL
jgi:hypothetical protein